MGTSRHSVPVSGTAGTHSQDLAQILVQNGIPLLVIGATSSSRSKQLIAHPSLQWQRPESQNLLSQKPFIPAFPCFLPFAPILPSPTITSHSLKPDEIGPGLEALHQSNPPTDALSAFFKHICAQKPLSFLPFLFLPMILDSILDRKHPHPTFEHGASGQDPEGWRARERIVQVSHCEQHQQQWIMKKKP